MLGDKLSCVWSSSPLTFVCVHACTHVCKAVMLALPYTSFPGGWQPLFMYYASQHVKHFCTPISLDLWSVFSGEELKWLAIEDTVKVTPHCTFHDIVARRGILKLDPV